MKWLDKFTGADVHIVRYGRRFVIPSAVIFAVGLILFLIIGFNLGLDFTGGAIAYIDAAKTEEAEIREVMVECGVPNYELIMQKGTDGDDVWVLKFNTDADKTAEVNSKLPNVIEQNGISASTRDETIITVFTAVLLALLGILIYMLFRFKFAAGVATLLALGHDVLLMTALVVICRVQINAPFIAALITIIGYSINNSLVIFDRIRSLEKHNTDNAALPDIADKAIKMTLNRTFLTSFTTIVPVIVLVIISLIMGLSSLTDFTLPIIFGLIVGTYSSLFLITPMYCRFEGARLARRYQKAIAK
jgi:preprotein translocase SecF subunit